MRINMFKDLIDIVDTVSRPLISVATLGLVDPIKDERVLSYRIPKVTLSDWRTYTVHKPSLDKSLQDSWNALEHFNNINYDEINDTESLRNYCKVLNNNWKNFHNNIYNSFRKG